MEPKKSLKNHIESGNIGQPITVKIKWVTGQKQRNSGHLDQLLMFVKRRVMPKKQSEK